MYNFIELRQALINGAAPMVSQLTRAALDAGAKPLEVMNEGLIVAMDEVGRRFKANEFYFPEVLIAARAMHAGLDVLKPLLAESNVEPVGIYLIGTVKGDVHDIGKNLVSMMLEGAGFRVIDIGVDVPPEHFVEAVKKHKPDILGMSALLTTTMPAMRTVIEALYDASVRGQVKVMVGGAPVTQTYANEIGADGYAPDASTAVDVARALLGLG